MDGSLPRRARFSASWPLAQRFWTHLRMADSIASVVCSFAQHSLEVEYAIVIQTGFQHAGWRDAYLVAGGAEQPGIPLDYADGTL